VTAFSSARFPEPWLTLPSDGYRRLLDALTVAALRGGATYDALIGWTARHHGASVVTLDRRAASTYDALGVSFDLVD
jgi:predicted nucleic acid-binding protein